MKIFSVTDPEFKPYGRVVTGLDTAKAEIVAALANTPLPVATDYVAEDAALQELPAAVEVSEHLFGGMPCQLGWCNGHNTYLNCLEYHRDSEFNLGTEDFVLLLARQEEIAGGKLDTAELDAEMEALRKQLRQLTGTKDRLGEQIDALDFDDPHYTRKAQDLQERQNRVYDQIASIEVSIAEVQTRMDNIRQRRISTDNVYQFLLYFDKLYDQFTDLEKKTFMNSFIERVEIYPERRSDGRIVKRIEFRFPVYFNGSKITGLGWDETDMSKTVMVLSKLSDAEQYRH